jgi:hypothetical protein
VRWVTSIRESQVAHQQCALVKNLTTNYLHSNSQFTLLIGDGFKLSLAQKSRLRFSGNRAAIVFAVAVAQYTINAVVEQINYGRSGQVDVADTVPRGFAAADRQASCKVMRGLADIPIHRAASA